MEKFAKFLLAFLKQAVVKAAFKKLVLSSVGLKAWLVKFLIEEIFEQVLEPGIMFLIDNGELYYDKQRGKILIKKVNRARENQDQDSYNRNINNIFK